MVNYASAKQEYLTLAYADKKIKLIALFDIFKEQSVAIQQMFPLLQTDQLKDVDMIEAYNDLVDAIQSVEWEKLQASLSQIESLHLKIEELRQQEAMERAKENPDDLLQQM